jgi:hypothetical protein
MRLGVGTLAFVAFVGFAGTTYAQVPTNPNILDAVENLQTTVDSLTERVITLQNSVNALSSPPQANVRFTPTAANERGEGYTCEAVNVTAVTLILRAQVFGVPPLMLPPDGRDANDTGNSSVPPGGRLSTGRVTWNDRTTSPWCKFTVVAGGSRADIRGSLMVFTGGVNEVQKLSVPAE